MKLLQLVSIVIFLLFTSFSPAQEKTSSSVTEFNAYKIVFEYNMFDANRNKSLPPKPVVTPLPPPLLKIDYITLTGVIISQTTTATGGVAFFHSTQPQYSINLAEGMEIVGFRIIKMYSDKVIFIKNGKRVILLVGKKLEGQEKEEWKVSGSQPVTDNKTSSTVSVEDNSDLLKKLLERRKREIED